MENKISKEEYNEIVYIILDLMENIEEKERKRFLENENYKEIERLIYLLNNFKKEEIVKIIKEENKLDSLDKCEQYAKEAFDDYKRMEPTVTWREFLDLEYENIREENKINGVEDDLYEAFLKDECGDQ